MKEKKDEEDEDEDEEEWTVLEKWHLVLTYHLCMNEYICVFTHIGIYTYNTHKFMKQKIIIQYLFDCQSYFSLQTLYSVMLFILIKTDEYTSMMNSLNLHVNFHVVLILDFFSVFKNAGEFILQT